MLIFSCCYEIKFLTLSGLNNCIKLVVLCFVLMSLGLGSAANEFTYAELITQLKCIQKVGDRLHKGCTIWLGDMKT